MNKKETEWAESVRKAAIKEINEILLSRGSTDINNEELKAA
ncbi:MAG: hypothetical protein ACXWT0_00045 [Methylobacter sp.]